MKVKKIAVKKKKSSKFLIKRHKLQIMKNCMYGNWYLLVKYGNSKKYYEISDDPLTKEQIVDNLEEFSPVINMYL